MYTHPSPNPRVAPPRFAPVAGRNLEKAIFGMDTGYC